MPKFYMIFAQKIFFRNFGVLGARAQPAPISYAYGLCLLSAVGPKIVLGTDLTWSGKVGQLKRYQKY